MPGLLGVVLTMTMMMFTALAVTREIERGTMESLLAMPIKPIEIMIGKIAPFVLVGFVQMTIILVAAYFVFDVPILGSVPLLITLSTLFAASNLAVGYTFSTVAKNQLQAVQMTFFFFLPNFLLSGFAFPFRGMPQWAQWIGETLPLTHFIRIVRGIMLKGNGFADMRMDVAALFHLHDRSHGARAVPLPQDTGLAGDVAQRISVRDRNGVDKGRTTARLSCVLWPFSSARLRSMPQAVARRGACRWPRESSHQSCCLRSKCLRQPPEPRR